MTQVSHDHAVCIPASRTQLISFPTSEYINVRNDIFFAISQKILKFFYCMNEYVDVNC
jgi:hypothetical protein